jgi:hypothetical protein
MAANRREDDMSKFRMLPIVAVTLALIVTACGAEPTNTPLPDLPNAAVAARQALASELGIAEDEIDVVSFSQEDWPDACLGLAETDEMCAQVITPGWRVVLSAEGQEYVYRTDESGESIRREE